MANTHGVPDVAKELGSWFGEPFRGWIVSGGSPAVPGASDTFAAFATAGYVPVSGRLVYVSQGSHGIGPLDDGPGSYWLALHHDRSSTVGGWTRQAASHYLWQVSPTQPAEPSGGLIFAKVTVAGGVITAVRTLHPGTLSSERVIKAADYGVTMTSHLTSALTWIDQTANLQAALDAALDAFYGETDKSTRAIVELETGQCYLAGRVEIGSGVTLRGAGKFATVVFSDNAFADADGLLHCNGIGGAPTVIEGMAVTIAGAAPAPALGVHAEANGTFIRDVWVSGFGGGGIRLDATDCFLSDFVAELNTGAGVSIANNHITVSDGLTYQNGEGISIDNSGAASGDQGEVVITNVRDTQSNAVGFALIGRNITLSNCSAWSDDDSKYSNAALYATSVSRVSITNFTAHIANDQHATGRGMRLDGATSVVVSNARCRGWRYGIEVNGSSQVAISNCLVENSREYGFRVTGSDRVTLTGNQAIANGTAATTDAGFYIDNTVNFALLTLAGNLATQTGGGVQEFGFDLYNTGGSAQILMLGNAAAFNATADVRENGTTAEKQGIRHEGVGQPTWRRLSAAATLNFGAIAAQTEARLTIAVPGARLGNVDPVFLGIGAAAQAPGIVYAAFVTADDVVTVQAANITSGSIDPAPDTFTVVVEKLAR